MAHGMGCAVEDASTTVKFSEGGDYHVYVSTYNWTAPWYDGEGPGAFQLKVDNRILSDKLGATGSCWGWQYAGRVTLSAGEHEVRLHDLTGFNGRADAIYFTKTKEAPTVDYHVFAAERRRLLGYTSPQVIPEVDLVVVGGGIAGCTTALTAARYGLRVVLVDNLPWLGGNNALGVRASGLLYKNLYPQLGNVTCQVTGVELSAKNDPAAYQVDPTGFGDVKYAFYEQHLRQPTEDLRGSDMLDAIERLKFQGEQSANQQEQHLKTLEHMRRNASLQRERLLRKAGVQIYHNIHVFDVIREGSVSRVNVFKLAKSIAFRGHSLPIVRAMVRWVIWLRQTIALDAKAMRWLKSLRRRRPGIAR